VVLNRSHSQTTDTEFQARLEKLRQLWPQAVCSSLPLLTENGMFSPQQTSPLTAECSKRNQTMIQETVRNLARDFTGRLGDLAEVRRQQRFVLDGTITRQIHDACSFRKMFFSDEFRQRLDSFSPWKTSLRRLKGMVSRSDQIRMPNNMDLFSTQAVERHAIERLEKLRALVQQHLEHCLSELPPDRIEKLPLFNKESIDNSVRQLVQKINIQARKDVETMLTTLQEHRRVKDPMWSILTAAAGTMLVLDLLIPSVGTISSLTLSGVLSALGFGGMMTSDLLRRFRSSRLRETFENGLKLILEQAMEPILESKQLSQLSLDKEMELVASWARSIPEV